MSQILARNATNCRLHELGVFSMETEKSVPVLLADIKLPGMQLHPWKSYRPSCLDKRFLFLLICRFSNRRLPTSRS